MAFAACPVISVPMLAFAAMLLVRPRAAGVDPHEDLVSGPLRLDRRPALKVEEYLASVKKRLNPPAPNIRLFRARD